MPAQIKEFAVGNPNGNIVTYTGRLVNLFDFKVSDVDEKDIACALSNLCRFNGHVDYFYSVGQHSVLCAEQFDIQDPKRKRAILHDASEAYLGDVVRPLKHSGHYEFYLQLEDHIQRCIYERFGIVGADPPEIKEVDILLRNTEMRDLKRCVVNNETKALRARIKAWNPTYTRFKFMEELKSLGLV